MLCFAYPCITKLFIVFITIYLNRLQFHSGDPPHIYNPYYSAKTGRPSFRNLISTVGTRNCTRTSRASSLLVRWSSTVLPLKYLHIPCYKFVRRSHSLGLERLGYVSVLRLKRLGLSRPSVSRDVLKVSRHV